MIFEFKVLSEIEDNDIKQLVIDHVSENEHLEYKLTINYKTEEGKYEVLCDITSLANAGGGYLVIGIRDDGKGKAQKFEHVENADRILKSIQSLCLDYISERIIGIESNIRKIDSMDILIYRVPESLSVPHMVTYKNSTHFVTRYNDGKREMTIGEIRSKFNNDGKILANIKMGVDYLVKNQKFESNQELLSMLESGQISGSNIEDGAIISEAARKKFIKGIANKPFFRISITPTIITQSFINLDLPNIKELIENPPNQRETGWNMDGSYSETKRLSEMLFRKGIYGEVLALKQNGFMEFYIEIGNLFCWTQPEEEFKKRPRLYPYPVVEYPLTFLKLYRAIIDTLKIEMTYIVTMEYYNIKGFVLYPYHPNSNGYKVPQDYILPFDKENTPTSTIKVEKDFNPDKVTFNLVKNIYNSFGYSDDKIPFYNKDLGEFNIE